MGRRWWTRAVLVGLGVALALGPVGSRRPAEADGGDDLVEACQPLTTVAELGLRTCRSVEAGTVLAAQACRRVDGLEEAVCPTLDGRTVSEAALATYESSWLARALALQRSLDVDVPLTQTLIPHTHNSANSAAYAPSLSTLDANQVLTLTDQLRLGIRAIEIDVHWVPSPSGDQSFGTKAALPASAASTTGCRAATSRKLSSSASSGRHQVPGSASRAQDCSTSSSASAAAQAASLSAARNAPATRWPNTSRSRAAARSAASPIRRSSSESSAQVNRAPLAMPWRSTRSGWSRNFSTAAAGASIT